MFVFITSIRHPRNSSYYENVWDLLRDTLFSVCSQTCQSFKTIVVCNNVLDDFSSIPRIRDHVEFVEVDYPPPSDVKGPLTGVPACNMDRGFKYVIGLIAAKKYDPEYIMFFDADDFVSKYLVRKALRNPEKPGWTFRRGYFYQESKISNRGRFNSMCGTSHILNYDMLTKDIRFDNLSINSSQIDISENVHPFFIKGVLGCHMNYETYFFNMHNALGNWPDPGPVAYNMGTGENHSGKNSSCGEGWFPLRKRGSGQLERAVYELNLPLVDHKSKRIGITIPDINCRKAMKKEGLYNSAELSASDCVAIYGDQIWEEYETIAFVRNPWERLVNLYSSRNQYRFQSFSEFVRNTDVKTQSSYLKNNYDYDIDIIKKSEEVCDDKFYWEHYSKYYTPNLHDYVLDKFSEDINRFDYTFEGDTNFSHLEVVRDADYKRIKIDKAFCVCLAERQSAWLKFKTLDFDISLQRAVDSRVNKRIYEYYGLSLDPADPAQIAYFSQASGAVGCYLSHYLIWKRIVDEGIEWSMIIEEDAHFDDVEDVLARQEVMGLKEDVSTLIQLNRRTPVESLPYYFNGTESYVVNYKAAQSLLALTESMEYLKDAKREYLCFPGQKALSDKFKKMESTFETKSAIRYAADTYIGHCSLVEIPDDLRLRILVQPNVRLADEPPGVTEDLETSTVMFGNDKPFWSFNKEEYLEFEKSEAFEWWKK